MTHQEKMTHLCLSAMNQITTQINNLLRSVITCMDFILVQIWLHTKLGTFYGV